MPTVDITANDARIQYTASASQTAFVYDFIIFDQADIVVVKAGSILTLGAGDDYTVSGVGAAAGGTVTLTTGATSGDKVTLYRDSTISRGSQYQVDGRLDAAPLERDLDRITTILQEQDRDLKRSIQLDVEDTLTSLTLPTRIPGRGLKWNPAGDGFVNTTLDPDTVGTEAAQSATEAAQSATDAATSETNAATSETNAATSETNAATSATNAATSATNAATSATNAATSETNAATSETNAATSATNAATSATNAATSATNAQTTLDNFDDVFLGAKASDPALDNDGDALVAGAIYLNTTSSLMRFYNGTSWISIAPGISNVLDDTTPQLGGDLDVNGNAIEFAGGSVDNLATKAQAEAGTATDKLMTPLRTKQAVAVRHDQEADTSAGSGTVTLNANNGVMRKVTATGNITIDFTPTAGRPCSYVLQAVNFGAHTITWTGVDEWAGGTAPALTSSGEDFIGIIGDDGGLTYGYLIIKGAA